MKLLIDVPNGLYANLSRIKNGSIATRRLLECIKHGAPYDPKGDLISRDDLLKRVDEEREYLKSRGQTGAEHILVHNFRGLVEDAPTVSSLYAMGYKAGYEASKNEE